MKRTDERIDQILNLMSKIGTILNDIDARENVLASFTEVFPNIIFWLDADGVIIDYFTLNPSMLYVEPKKFLKKNMKEVLPPDVGTTLKKGLDMALEARSTQTVEYNLKMVDGIKWFVAYFVPLRSNTVFVTIKDITAIKAVQDAVPVERLLRQKLMDTSPVAIVLVDKGGRISVANPAAERLFQVPKERLVGTLIFDQKWNLKEENGKAVSEKHNLLSRMVNGKETFRGIRRSFKRLNGETVELQIEGTPLLDEKGEAQGIIGFLQDITEKNKAERQLKEKTEFLQEVLDNASDGIFVLDDNSNYIYINEECGHIVGLDPKEWVGKRAGLAIHPDDAERVLTQFMTTIGGERTRFEARLQGADRGYRILDIKLSPLKWAGQTHVLGVVTDNTDRKMAETLKKEVAKEKIYEVLVSILPGFAASIPEELRDSFVMTFSNKFEAIEKPKFENAMERFYKETGLSGDPSEHPDVVLKGYIKWLMTSFQDLGATVESSFDGPKAKVSLERCIWLDEAKGNTNFCLICKAMAIRSFAWTGLNGKVVQKVSSSSRDRPCTMEFIYPEKDGGKA